MGSTDTNYGDVTQLAISIGTSNIYIRTRNNTNWSSWKLMVHREDLDSYQLKETVLYNNTTGTTGNITLSQSSANFNYLEIFFKDSYSNCGSVKVYSPNGKNVDLFLGEHYFLNNVNNKQFLFRKVSISDTIIGNVEAGYMLVVENTIVTNDTTNYIYIIRVVGYK